MRRQKIGGAGTELLAPHGWSPGTQTALHASLYDCDFVGGKVQPLQDLGKIFHRGKRVLLSFADAMVRSGTVKGSGRWVG